jgi:hypothetical protein
MPADKVAVGFLTGDTTPNIVSQAMDYIVTGKPAGLHARKLRDGTVYTLLIPPAEPSRHVTIQSPTPRQFCQALT